MRSDSAARAAAVLSNLPVARQTVKPRESGVNPQGCQVNAFKAPSAEDLDHDYLWRCLKCAPNRGHIGIFNRSL
jgi:polyphosphate kinase 2 (PPK2 family)